MAGLTNGAAHTFQVRAAAATLGGAASKAVTATPAAPDNNAPVFASEMDSRSVAENSAANTNVGVPVTATDPDSDTLTYSLSGMDAASFAIGSATGQITVASGTSLDYESSTKSYTVTVSVSDGEDAAGNADATVDDTITVTINVTDVDEAGAVALSPAQPVVGTEITATLKDEDATVSNTVWQWARSSDGMSNWGDIDSATSASYTPVDADLNQYLRATATYDDTHSTGKSAQAVSVNQVQAAPVVNLHPIFSDGTATTRSVAENSPQGTNVGTAVTAIDADSLTYSLSGTDQASFDIESASGQITVRSGTSLDFESKNSYVVEVTAAGPPAPPTPSR